MADTHSIADTGDEVLLYVGVRRGLRPADDRHPLGYGQARFFWSLLAAVGIFVVGGLFAINDGVQSLRHPEPVTYVAVGVAVLLVSAGLEGLSWRTAHRQLRAEASARHLDLGEYVATSSDPLPSTVFLEDSAALVGLALAMAALLLHLVTGSAVWDAVASLLIGLLCARAPQRRCADRRGGPDRRPRGAAAGCCRRAMGGRGGRADRGVRRPQAPAGACPRGAGRGRRPDRPVGLCVGYRARRGWGVGWFAEAVDLGGSSACPPCQHRRVERPVATDGIAACRHLPPAGRYLRPAISDRVGWWAS